MGCFLEGFKRNDLTFSDSGLSSSMRDYKEELERAVAPYDFIWVSDEGFNSSAICDTCGLEISGRRYECDGFRLMAFGKYRRFEIGEICLDCASELKINPNIQTCDENGPAT